MISDMGERYVRYMTADELFKGAVPSTSFKEAREEFLRELEQTPIHDRPEVKQAVAWSELGNLIVGEEHKGPQDFYMQKRIFPDFVIEKFFEELSNMKTLFMMLEGQVITK